MDAEVAVLEPECRGGEVEPPHARSSGADEPEGVVPGSIEVGDPCLERPDVVFAQRLDVVNFEPGRFHRQRDLADVDQLTVGEHVAADE